MKSKLSIFLCVLIMAISFSSCKVKTVDRGYAAVKFKKYGSEKGINKTPLGPGWYTIGINEDLFLLPTFTQNYVWTSDSTEGSPTDESLNFQDIQGLELNADLGITYHVDITKAADILEKYNMGLSEITDLYLRNMIRDALVMRASKMDVADIYGSGKAGLIAAVQEDVSKQCAPIGIIVEKIYLIGRIKVPAVVKAAIDAKINATQLAQQRENEIREVEAAAAKKVAEATGTAEALTINAKAEAAANKLISASMTPLLVEKLKVERWDGKLPGVTGGGIPFLNLK